MGDIHLRSRTATVARASAVTRPSHTHNMLVVLLAIVLRARAEWVEIAQNSYRRTSFKKVPVTTEFTPETYKNYPNATLDGPDWHRGYVSRVEDVRRIPGPAQDPGAGAANKQEYYNIDGPDEVNIPENVASRGQDHTEVPVGINNVDYEDGVLVNSGGNKWENTKRPPIEKAQTESVKQIRNKNSQQTGIVDEQSKYKGQRVNLNQEVNVEDHLNLHKIMQHFGKTLKKPNEEHRNTNITKGVELEIKNTLTQTVSSEKLNQETDSEEKTDIPKIVLDKNKIYFPGILRLLKTVANIISKNTQRSVNSKIKYLEDLKNKLLYNIQERVDSVWPGAGRAARGVEARGHVELPSSEGALMTISFLTFAVFLIKLVLQIIHTYKNKTTMMTPAVVTAVGRLAKN